MKTWKQGGIILKQRVVLIVVAIALIIVAISVGFFIIRNRNSSELPIYSFEVELRLR